MRALGFLLLFATAVVGSAKTTAVPAGLSDAVAARAMLSADTWARIVRLDNTHPRGPWRAQAYPRVVYALVFEFSGALWLYTDSDGTQSLSLTRGTLERDKVAPGVLFRAIEPGISSWEWVGGEPAPGNPASRQAPRACFLESLRALDRLLAGGGKAESPELLLYYLNTPIGKLGHTVLLFRSGGSLFAIDATVSDRPVKLSVYLGADPLAIAEYLREGPVSAARVLAIPGARKPQPGRWVTIPAQAQPAG